MRTLSVGMLMATMGAAVAAEAPGPQEDITSWKLLPPEGQALIPPDGLFVRKLPATAQATTPVAPIFTATCYFIRQVNPNLQAPRDTPELIPLAADSAAPSYAISPNCLTASLVRKEFWK